MSDAVRNNHSNTVYLPGGQISATIFDGDIRAGNMICWVRTWTSSAAMTSSMTLNVTPDQMREISAMLLKSAAEVDALVAERTQVTEVAA